MALTFEELPADRQKMTFKTYRDFSRKLWGEGALPDGVYARSKVYNNFALLLADQCPWHIVVRGGTEERTYIGPLVIQMQECLGDIKDSIPFVNLMSKAAKYKRFPGLAVQEALVNAVMHFDPSLMRNITVELNEDLMTITSPGGLIDRTEFGRLESTSPRNMRTSMLLENMGYAKMAGRGMGLIRGCYCTSGLMPVVIGGDDNFCIQLPSLDNTVKTFDQGAGMVLAYLRDNGNGNIISLSKQLMLSVHRVKVILDILESDGKIITMGIGSKRTAFFLKPATAEEDPMPVNEITRL